MSSNGICPAEEGRPCGRGCVEGVCLATLERLAVDGGGRTVDTTAGNPTVQAVQADLRQKGLLPGPGRTVAELAAAEEAALVEAWADRHEMIATALLEHHPVQPGDGPLTGCQCGQLQLGQSWSRHVADVLAGPKP